MHLTTGEEEIFATSIFRTQKIDDLSEIDIPKTVGHWQANAAPAEKRYCILETCVDRFLDHNFVCGVSDRVLLSIFVTRVNTPGIPYKPEYSHSQPNILRVKLACSEIAQLLKYAVGTPELEQYRRIVRILSALPIMESSLIRKVLEDRIGPITALAASVSAANVNWFMGKLKASNAIPLFHQVFSSTTLLGKLNAIWKLLELYDLIWEGVDWALVSQIVQSVYSMFFFLVDKCKLAANFVAQGFTWVKPTQIGTEEEKCAKQAAGLIAGAETLMELDLTRGNDCLYEAVAPQICQDAQTLKKNFCAHLRRIGVETANQILTENGRTLEDMIYEYDESLGIRTGNDVWDEIVRHAGSGDLKDQYTCLFLSEFIQRNIIMIAPPNNFENKRLINSPKPIYIKLSDMHFTLAEPQVVKAKNCGLACEREIPLNTCNLCAQFANDTCALCAKWVCHRCFATCCSVIQPIVVVQEGAVDLTNIKTPYDETPDSTSSSSSESSISSKSSSIIDPSEEQDVNSDEEDAHFDTYIENKSFTPIKFNNPPPAKENNSNKPDISSVFSSDSVEDTWTRVKSFFSLANLNSISSSVLAFLEEVFGNVYAWLKDNPILVGLVSLIGAVSSLLGFGLPTVLNSADKRSIISKLSEATKNVYYAQRTGASILDSFKDFGNAIATTLGISSDAQVNDFKKRVVELTLEANNYLARAQTDPASIVNSNEAIILFKKKMVDVEKAYVDLVKYSEKANLSVLAPVWQQLNKSYQALTQLWVKYTNCMTERQEPVVLWVYGETNHGKSKMINHIIEQLNQRENREMSTFTISKGPAFWNGYIGQHIIKIDDFGCWTGPEGNLDALHMFNLKTCAAYNPNMAGLDVKEIMATPKYVIIASNEPTIPLNTAIMDTKAFERRRDFLIKVTWPGHEKCAEEGNCEHIQKVRAEFEQSGVENYDHLALFACGANVSSYHKNGKKTIRSIPPKSDITGQRISLPELVDAMLNLEKTFERQHKLTLEKRMRPASKQTVAERFTEYPNVILSGPPGTSKSYIMDRVAQSTQVRTQRIQTTEQFNAFVDGGFKTTPGVQMVLFDDLSTWIGDLDEPDNINKRMCAFLKQVKNRADTISEDTTVWTMGINPIILRPILGATFAPVVPGSSVEVQEEAIERAENMLYRRATVIETKFKAKPNLLRRLVGKQRFYCAQDMQKEPRPQIDEVVQFKIVGEADPRGQSTIINWVCNRRCVVEEVSTIDSLPPAIPRIPDCSATLDITAKELLHLVTDAPLPKILSFITSDAVRVNSGEMSKATILEKIKKTVKAAKAHAGCVFNSLEEFWLTCSNEKYLAHFDGMVSYIILKDAAYSIEQGKFDFPVVHSLDQGLMDQAGIIVELQKIQQTVSTAEFLTFSSTQFSPWFCYVGDIIVQAAKMFATAGSVAHSLADNRKAEYAIQLFDQVERITKEHTSQEVMGIADSLAGKLAIGNSGRTKHVFALDNAESDPLDRYREIITTEQGPTDPTGKRGDVLKNTKPQRETPPRKDRDNTLMTTKPKKETPPRKDREDVLTKTKARKQCCHEDIGDYETVGGQITIYDASKERVQAVVPIDALPRLAAEEKVVLEACADPEVLPLADKVARSILTIENVNGSRVCFALAIKDTLATTVWHVLPTYPNLKGLVCIDVNNNKYTMKVVAEHIITDRLDFELIPYKGAVQFPDITRHLAPGNYKGYIGRECMLVNVSRTVTKSMPVLVMRTYRATQAVTKYDEDIARNVNLIEFIGHKAGFLSTGVFTRAGDCGSLLIVSDSGHNEGKIIGLHSRATTSCAYVRPIHKEDYVNPIKEVAVCGLFSKYIQAAEGDDGTVAVAKKKVFHTPKTRLYRNIAPCGPKLFEPAILGPTDQRNPGHYLLEDESEKWRVTPPSLSEEDQALLLECAEDIALHYRDVLERNHCTLTVLTKMQALNKYQPATHSEPIVLKTSPGFPWNQLTKSSGKYEFLDMDITTGIRRFRKSALVTEMHNEMNSWKLAALGKQPVFDPPIFQVHLKDEPTKLKNIYETPKTRTIVASPLTVQTIHRQYIHPAIACIMDCHMELPVAVGINANSPEWDIMFRQAMSVGDSFVAMDYKGWDFSVHPFLIQKCLPRFYNILYQSLDKNWKLEDDLVRDWIYDTVSQAHILIGNKIKQIKRGIVSGLISTAVDNSLMNDFQKYFVWKKQMRRIWPEIQGYDHFNRNVFRKYYGDDFFLAISKQVREYYNGLIIKEIEEKTFGTTLTAADKVSKVQKWQPFNEISFMSREFAIINEKCVGRLEWQRVCKPTYWVHDDRSHLIWESPDDVAHNLEACFSAYESALSEAVHWGRAKFEEIRGPAQKAFNLLEYPKTLPDFGTLFAEVNGMPAPLASRHDFFQAEATEILQEVGLNTCHPPEDAKTFRNRKAWHYGPSYAYSGVMHQENPIPDIYRRILSKVNDRFGRRWNSITINEYQKDGEIPWHKDNEPEVDMSEGVGCLTVCGDGVVQLVRPREPFFQANLKRGDFYIMEESCLKMYDHRRIGHTIKTISITFRRIVSPEENI